MVQLAHWAYITPRHVVVNGPQTVNNSTLERFSIFTEKVIKIILCLLYYCVMRNVILMILCAKFLRIFLWVAPAIFEINFIFLLQMKTRPVLTLVLAMVIVTLPIQTQTMPTTVRFSLVQFNFIPLLPSFHDFTKVLLSRLDST